MTELHLDSGGPKHKAVQMARGQIEVGQKGFVAQKEERAGIFKNVPREHFRALKVVVGDWEELRAQMGNRGMKTEMLWASKPLAEEWDMEAEWRSATQHAVLASPLSEDMIALQGLNGATTRQAPTKWFELEKGETLVDAVFRMKVDVTFGVLAGRVMVTIPSLKKNGRGNDGVGKARNMCALAGIMNAVLQCDALEVSGPAGNKFIKAVAHEEAKATVAARPIQLQRKIRFEVDNMPLEGPQKAQFKELLGVTMAKVADQALCGFGIGMELEAEAFNWFLNGVGRGIQEQEQAQSRGQKAIAAGEMEQAKRLAKWL